jgi:general secretion pathway protein A
MAENPFAGTPDPKYFYESPTHAEAKSSLIVGLECGVGFQALIAPPGMGKTTILFDVMQQFEPVARTALLFQPRGDYRDVLRYLLSELGDHAGPEFLAIQERVNELLLREHEAGRRTIVVVDEAQSLDSETLETLRLLSNFETPSEKLLQIVLAGQPQLAKNLADPCLHQLHQRISILKTLVPLDMHETEKYIQHRLWVAGYGGESLFTSAAIKLIWETSYGVPREINTLCFNAILLVTALKKKRIDEDILSEVIADLAPEVNVSRLKDSSDSRQKPGEKKQQQRLSTTQMQFYNLKRNPFDRVPDPSFLCLTSTHWRALAGLYTRIVKDGGSLMLIGAPGSGKSLVASCVMKLLSSNDVIVEYIAAEQFLSSKLIDGFRPSSEPAFTSGILNCSGKRVPAVLFIDEAEKLSAKSWQEIQAFRNRAADNRTAIVIVGRPEIENVLASAELEVLNRAIKIGYRLHDLGTTEIENYISCRVRSVQCDSETTPVFQEDAISAVCSLSHGNPGAINRLCEAALVKAYAEGDRHISANLINEVAREPQPNVTPEERAPRHHPGSNAELLKAAGVLLDLHLALHARQPEPSLRGS